MALSMLNNAASNSFNSCQQGACHGDPGLQSPATPASGGRKWCKTGPSTLIHRSSSRWKIGSPRPWIHWLLLSPVLFQVFSAIFQGFRIEGFRASWTLFLFCVWLSALDKVRYNLCQAFCQVMMAMFCKTDWFPSSGLTALSVSPWCRACARLENDSACCRQRASVIHAVP